MIVLDMIHSFLLSYCVASNPVKFQDRCHFKHIVFFLLKAGLCVSLTVHLILANAVETQLASKQAQTVLILGDSLSAEYGIPRGSGWVQLMAQQAAQEKKAVKVINASISGDTTAGGVTRLPFLLKQHAPAILIIELGGNDALRGLSLTVTQQNLLRMSRDAKNAGAKVMLIAIQMPPNYGQTYRQQLSDTYVQISKETGAQLNTQFLKGVGDDADPLKWFQEDRIHPNEKAQPILMANVWPSLKKMISGN
jgi:acyl-CoA thioesterase-1